MDEEMLHQSADVIKIQETLDMGINCDKEDCVKSLSINTETERQYNVETEIAKTSSTSRESLEENNTDADTADMLYKKCINQSVNEINNAESMSNNFVSVISEQQNDNVLEKLSETDNENACLSEQNLNVTEHLKYDTKTSDSECCVEPKCNENVSSQKSQAVPVDVVKIDVEITSNSQVNSTWIDQVLQTETDLADKTENTAAEENSSAVCSNVIIQDDNKIDQRVEQHSKDTMKKPKRKVLKKKKPNSQNESTVIPNGNTCSSDKMNNSLNQLMSYQSESDSSDTNINQVNSYRQQKIGFSEDSENSDSDTSSTSSSTSLFFSNLSDCVESEDEEDNNCGVKKKTTQNNNNKIKTTGELDLDDLPPVEDLRITVLEDECLPIGKIFQIVDKLIVVQSLKQTPVIDLDSVLFVEGGHALGRVYDVFGPVTEPYYCVRFNSPEQIKDRNIVKDQMVYVAPKTKHTNYVFVSHLLKMKGSDASWTDNNEPPPHCLDYSDDEEERAARKKSTKVVKTEIVDVDEPVRKRPNAYEQRMNERNLRMNMISANTPRVGYRRRLYNNNAGKNFRQSELIWPPSISPSPYPPSPQGYSMDPFISTSPFPPPPSNYQFRNPSFPPQPPVNPQRCQTPHQFGNPLFSPVPNQYSNSPLPPPSPVHHQFGSLPFQTMNQMGNSFQRPPPMQQFGNSSIQPLNFHFGNLPLPQASTSYFGQSIPQPPVNAFPQLPSFRAQFTSINSPLQHPLRPPSYIRSPPPLQWNNFKR